MSMFGGLGGGGDSEAYKPTKAPPVPRRSDENIDRRTMRVARQLASKSSYSQSILGGSADAPTISFASKLFSGQGGM